MLFLIDIKQKYDTRCHASIYAKSFWDLACLHRQIGTVGSLDMHFKRKSFSHNENTFTKICTILHFHVLLSQFYVQSQKN